ncbi:helix-turn-helix domain-containing protein [Streptomyces sp. NPDC007074]|uniref:helix-turn-helix domain-containing protein n=1 Tax=Streptomyces sp. NPDC007074 TaxID=3156764 RepID=UPI003410FA81
MHLRYSFRIEPTPGQRVALARTFGCARVVYNDALAARKAAWAADKSRIPAGALARQVITEAKRTASGRGSRTCPSMPCSPRCRTWTRLTGIFSIRCRGSGRGAGWVCHGSS